MMRHFFTLLLTVAALCTSHAQYLTFETEKPSPGEEVSFFYQLDGSPMEEATEIYAVATLIDAEGLESVDVPLYGKDGKYRGVFPTNEETRAVFVKMENASGKLVDNNEEKGYKLVLYKENKEKPVPGAYAALGRAYAFYTYTLGVKRDYERAYKKLKKEFTLYPKAIEDDQSYYYYALFASRNEDEAAMAEARAKAEAIGARKGATEEEVKHAIDLYNALKDAESAKALREKLKEQYPDALKRQELRQKFYSAQSLAEKEEVYQEYKQLFQEEEGFEEEQGRLLSSLAFSAGKENDWEAFQKYLGMIESPVQKAGALNSAAWRLAGEGLEGEAENNEKALELAEQAIQIMEGSMEYIDYMDSEDPSLSKRQWKKVVERQYGMYADTYALALYRAGKAEKAFEYQSKACEQNGFQDGEMNERYAIYMEKVKGPEATVSALSRLISQGTASEKMKEQHKRLYMEHYTLEKSYDLYRSLLEKEAMEKAREEMREKMIEKEAPAFSLTNLDGETVSLSSLKGKTIVLDFWATWCGPCKISFPGMQAAQDKYQDDEDVVFLFIDTWERGDAEAKKKNAAAFIKQNDYTFNVLMDDEDKVVADYGVEGIPTKFVIGPDGKIRFKSVGGNSNVDEIVNELTAMIEMARESKQALP